MENTKEIKNRIKEIKSEIKSFEWYLRNTSPTDDEAEFHCSKIKELEDELCDLKYKLYKVDEKYLDDEIKRFEKQLNFNPNHFGAKCFLNMLKEIKNN